MYEKFKRNMIYKIENSTADTNLYSLLLSEKESILNEVCLIFIVKNFGLKTEKKYSFLFSMIAHDALIMILQICFEANLKETSMVFK